MTDYKLKNIATGAIFEDTGWLLSDPSSSQPSLIRAEYSKLKLDLLDDSNGFYKFADWLPVKRFLKNSAPPVTYKSEKLAAALHLDNLYITFNGG